MASVRTTASSALGSPRSSVRIELRRRTVPGASVVRGTWTGGTLGATRLWGKGDKFIDERPTVEAGVAGFGGNDWNSGSCAISFGGAREGSNAAGCKPRSV